MDINGFDLVWQFSDWADEVIAMGWWWVDKMWGMLAFCPAAVSGTMLSLPLVFLAVQVVVSAMVAVDGWLASIRVG